MISEQTIATILIMALPATLSIVLVGWVLRKLVGHDFTVAASGFGVKIEIKSTASKTGLDPTTNVDTPTGGSAA